MTELLVHFNALLAHVIRTGTYSLGRKGAQA